MYNVDYFQTFIFHTIHFFSYSPSWIVGDLKIIREAMATVIKYDYNNSDYMYMYNTCIYRFWKSVKELKTVAVNSSHSQSQFYKLNNHKVYIHCMHM